MAVINDDIREHEMRLLFNLEKAEDAGRSGIDAVLRIDGRVVDFELKSTTGSTVSTVRDFGMDHIRKWQDLHWIIGFYDSRAAGRPILNSCIYLSPTDMAPWIEGRRAYVEPDIRLASIAASRLTVDDIKHVLGDPPYDRHDLERLQKRQYTAAHYTSYGESELDAHSVLDALRDRLTYLGSRGSTLNNPKIGKSFLAQFNRIEEDHATELRAAVRRYLT